MWVTNKLVIPMTLGHTSWDCPKTFHSLRTWRQSDTENDIDGGGLSGHIGLGEAAYPIATADFEAAGKIGLEDNLRSLDAIHIQIALRHSSEVFITYDKRQFDVAEKSGIRVVAPGMK
jgi:hypothetical protein